MTDSLEVFGKITYFFFKVIREHKKDTRKKANVQRQIPWNYLGKLQ